MSTHLKIITPKNIREFDSPPEFNGEERKKFLFITIWGKETIEGLRTPVSKVGFVLQLGYFKAVAKFFPTSSFHQKDIYFAANKLKIPSPNLDFSKYASTTLERHQEIILNNLGYRKFDTDTQNILIDEAVSLCSKQTKPRFIFLSLVNFLRSQKIEVPKYHALSVIITQALRNFDKNLISTLKRNLSEKDRQILDALIKEDNESVEGSKKELKLKRYRLTLLKRTHQSTKPSRVKENISDLKFLQPLFKELEPVIGRLGLSPGFIQYYAQIVIKSNIFQMHQRAEKRHLFLLAFVIHQFYQLNDVLIEILMKSVRSASNSSVLENKEKFFEKRQIRHQMINELSQKLISYLGVLERIETTVQNQELSDGEKICAVKLLLPDDQRREYTLLQEDLERLGKDSKRIIKNDDYYDILESKSLKLQKRASDIIKNLEFDKSTSNHSLLEGIDYYKNRDGNLTNPPIDFLNVDEQAKIFDDQQKFRISLYKTLLFQYVAMGIKSGALNLDHTQ